MTVYELDFCSTRKNTTNEDMVKPTSFNDYNKNMAGIGNIIGKRYSKLTIIVYHLLNFGYE
jgi:hypothetical protein